MLLQFGLLTYARRLHAVDCQSATWSAESTLAAALSQFLHLSIVTLKLEMLCIQHSKSDINTGANSSAKAGHWSSSLCHICAVLQSCGDLLVMDDDGVPAELSSGRSHFPAGSVQASPAQREASAINQQLLLLMLSLHFMAAVSIGYTHVHVLAPQTLTISLLREVTSAVDETRAGCMCSA
jgi:hypothetical protein